MKAVDDQYTFLPDGDGGNIKQCNDCGAYAFGDEVVRHFAGCQTIRSGAA